jgi:hypothetical protein
MGKRVWRGFSHYFRHDNVHLAQFPQVCQRINRPSVRHLLKSSSSTDGGTRVGLQAHGLYAVRERLAISQEYCPSSTILPLDVLTQTLTPQMSKSYSPIQTYEAKRLSLDLLDRPEDFYMHNRRYSASVIMNVVYGRAIPNC